MEFGVSVREHRWSILNRAEYASQITSYDRRMLNEYKAVREEVAVKEENLEEERQESLAFRTPLKPSRARYRR